MRLRGGFGTLCDPVHSGFIEILHSGEWGSICTDQRRESTAVDTLVADVVCRQLGFPHGTRVDPLVPRPQLPAPGEAPPTDSPIYYEYFTTEETEEPLERFWLTDPDVRCSGPETRLIDCDLRSGPRAGPGFLNNSEGCESRPHRIHIACRQFPVADALEAVTDPEAGAIRSLAQGFAIVHLDARKQAQ